jgi:hypothetical protein
VNALIAWAGCWIFVQAVDSFRQQPGSCGLSGAARSREQVCVNHPVTNHCIAQGLDDVLLSDNFVPFLGTPFIIESLGHEQYPSFGHGIR